MSCEEAYERIPRRSLCLFFPSVLHTPSNLLHFCPYLLSLHALHSHPYFLYLSCFFLFFNSTLSFSTHVCSFVLLSLHTLCYGGALWGRGRPQTFCAHHLRSSCSPRFYIINDQVLFFFFLMYAQRFNIFKCICFRNVTCSHSLCSCMCLFTATVHSRGSFRLS